MNQKTFVLAIGALTGLAAAVPQDKEFKRYDGGSPQLAAMEGKAPPALGGGEWLNTGGKKMDWKALKGKVVVLDFWAHW